MIDTMLQNVAVIGAAGKMGRGIALLLLQEMAMLKEKYQTEVTLSLIDTSQEGLDTLKPYLETHLKKFGEKHHELLRDIYKENPSLQSDDEIIDHFTQNALNITNTSTHLDAAAKASLIFEAILEDIYLKTEIFQKLKNLCSENTYIFSNTSSIPISILRDQANLNGKIIGYHFYNPPPVQKLLEIIPPEGVDPELRQLAEELGHRLNKTIVYSKDMAGFVGNGYCIPEAIYGFKKARKISSHYTIPLHEAIYMVNMITEQFLIRPMGLFQLLDYVGIDVFRRISNTMSKYLYDNSFQDPLPGQMMMLGAYGGQHPDGTQKDGFFQYEGKSIVGYFDSEMNRYFPFKDGDWRDKCHAIIGPLPQGHAPWKEMIKNPDRDALLQTYFENLLKGRSFGEQLAQEFLTLTKSIAKSLLKKGVAHSVEDISTVLKTGFYHLYGPDAPFLY